MKIERKRYVIMRNNRTEIWCGLARSFHFRKLEDVGKDSIKTYSSKNKAESSCSPWVDDREVVEVREIIETTEPSSDKIKEVETEDSDD